ncbi:MAG: sigma-70 family RNA polymerase sigma factor [Myxococcota bacterium]
MRTSSPPDSREELERQIRVHVDARRWDQAATCALRGYGGELLGFLHAVIGDPSEADEVFSAVCEAVWASLPKFRFESSFRTWLYGVTRNLAREHWRDRRRQRRHFAPLDGDSAAAKVAAAIRSTTAIHLRSQTKTRLQRIRDSLPPEDRMLLVLRLDRSMAWRDIARVLSEDEDLDLTRAAAHLRKRFERVKAKVAEQLRADAAGR